jgi:hypothetical protein
MSADEKTRLKTRLEHLKASQKLHSEVWEKPSNAHGEVFYPVDLLAQIVLKIHAAKTAVHADKLRHELVKGDVLEARLIGLTHPFFRQSFARDHKTSGNIGSSGQRLARGTR